MTFAELIRNLGIDTAPYVEIGESDVFLFRKTEEGSSLYFDTKKISKLSTKALAILAATKKENFLMQLEVYATCQVLGKGPKIFRPTAYQLSMLEKMQLNIEVKDFHMPFESIIVELPRDYIEPKDKSINISILHRKDQLFLHSCWQTGTVVKSWWAPQPDEHIESWFDKDYFKGALTDLPPTQEEQNAEMQIRRAVMNYCLLLDEVGIKKEGPASPNQYAQLVKWCQKKNEHTKKNKAALQAQPIIYSLAKQNIELVRETKSSNDPGDPTGRKMPAHSRRGHYRMQPCGLKNLERKRIRIPPTIVNKHLLMGPPPIAEYKT
jgi:hypothetical protein